MKFIYKKHILSQRERQRALSARDVLMRAVTCGACMAFVIHCCWLYNIEQHKSADEQLFEVMN